MKESELLDLAVKAINCRARPLGGNFAVGFYQGEIKCIIARKLPPDFFTARVYTTRQLQLGLTSAQWQELRAELIVIFRRLKA